MTKVTMSEESLKTLRLPELQAKYAEIVGEPTRTPNKAWLVRKILEGAMAAKKQTAAPKTRPSRSDSCASRLRAQRAAR